MKKTQKQVLGFLSLGVVAAMTAVAIALPSPGASAVSSVTDTIVVRVLAGTPDVNIGGITSGAAFADSKQTISVAYENVTNVTAVLKYTDLDGNEKTIEIANEDLDINVPGYLTFDIDFSDAEYGYGDYTLTVTGMGDDGNRDEDIITFSYIPFTADLNEDEDSNKTSVDLDYTPDDGTGTGENSVAKFVIEVYDGEGNLVSPLSPITVLPPETNVEIPFYNYDLAPGKYTIKITAYNRNDEALSVNYLYKVIDDKKVIPVPDTSAPDTGGLFRNLNISQADFLITGLIVFFMVGIAGIVFVARRDKKSLRRR